MEKRKNKVASVASEPENLVVETVCATQEEAGSINTAGESLPVLVVIPYLAGQAQGEELVMAITGWRMHFKENFRIVVIGDHHPIADDSDDITFIDCPRTISSDRYCVKHLEFAKVFRIVAATFPEYDGFIFAADDAYAVNDFELTDVKLLKMHLPVIDFPAQSANSWQRDKYRTRMLLEKLGMPVRNFTTHIPFYLETEKLLEILDRFNMDNESYVFEDLYFNIFYPDRRPLLLDIRFDNMRCGVWRSNPRIDVIKDAFNSKIWITNSVEGYIPELVRLLKNHYGIG